MGLVNCYVAEQIPCQAFYARLPVLDANGETFVAANVSPSSHALCVAVAPAKPASDLCDALRLVDQGGLLICVDSQGDGD